MTLGRSRTRAQRNTDQIQPIEPIKGESVSRAWFLGRARPKPTIRTTDQEAETIELSVRTTRGAKVICIANLYKEKINNIGDKNLLSMQGS